MNRKKIIFYLFLFALANSCCKDELVEPYPCNDPTNPECSNYDPCILINQQTGGFQILDSLDVSPDDIGFSVEVDTIWNGRRIYFQSSFEYGQEYAWQIGTDPTIYDSPNFDLYFGSSIQGNVPVRLLVKSELPSFCEGLITYDTLYKNLFFKELNSENVEMNEFPIFGTFSGYYDDTPNENHTITTSSFLFSTSDGIINFPNSTNFCGDSHPPIRAFYSYSTFILDTDSAINCDNPKGYGYINNDGFLIIEFTTLRNDGSRSELKKFVGSRI